ncbi:hypothetical protein LptCag_1497 [Leptospirillum ferriphilum]|jgi:hypothetical protein|uniref:Uncharacterized protein n=1 Tax=Leptospirillum ferriphilum TaxID=178606 RepID=A0A094WDS0_9BACT|nr:hypothetical protein [Leptospirillum ferriphilum]KGA93787.1 hypothetical protein LptCag_1497 [Leptospirillum ferriphilum]
MGSSEDLENDEPKYVVQDRRRIRLNKDSSLDIVNPPSLPISQHENQSDGRLLFEHENLSFYGRIDYRYATVLKVENFRWSDTNISVDVRSHGGGGTINTDHTGSVYGNINPVNIDTRVDSYSVDRSAQSIWYSFDDRPDSEIYCKNFGIDSREGHSLKFVYTTIDDLQPFLTKIVNMSTGYYLQFNFGIFLFNHVLKKTEETFFIRKSIFPNPFRFFRKPRKKIPNISDMCDEIMKGLKKMTV